MKNPKRADASVTREKSGANKPAELRRACICHGVEAARDAPLHTVVAHSQDRKAHAEQEKHAQDGDYHPKKQ